jgi:hypothetical protein
MLRWTERAFGGKRQRSSSEPDTLYKFFFLFSRSSKSLSLGTRLSRHRYRENHTYSVCNLLAIWIHVYTTIQPVSTHIHPFRLVPLCEYERYANGSNCQAWLALRKPPFPFFECFMSKLRLFFDTDLVIQRKHRQDCNALRFKEPRRGQHDTRSMFHQ